MYFKPVKEATAGRKEAKQEIPFTGALSRRYLVKHKRTSIFRYFETLKVLVCMYGIWTCFRTSFLYKYVLNTKPVNFKVRTYVCIVYGKHTYITQNNH